MSAALYIGVTCANGGLYRRGGGDVVQLERLSTSAATRWPARLVRILLARALLLDALADEPSAPEIETFADEVLGDVELGGIFSVERALVAGWLKSNGLEAA